MSSALPLYPLLVLVAITVGSTGMLLWNIHRLGRRRRHLELRQWLRNNQMSLTAGAPEILARLLPAAHWDRLISDADGARTLARGYDDHGRFHLLILRTSVTFPPTALRPIAPNSSQRLLDNTSLRPYPTLPGGERFTTVGTTLHAARTLADSPLRGLLPPDLSVLLDGAHLVLDFSSRPFDPLEFSRLLPLTDQLTLHLPAVK